MCQILSLKSILAFGGSFCALVFRCTEHLLCCGVFSSARGIKCDMTVVPRAYDFHLLFCFKQQTKFMVWIFIEIFFFFNSKSLILCTTAFDINLKLIVQIMVTFLNHLYYFEGFITLLLYCQHAIICYPIIILLNFAKWTFLH